MAYVNIMVGLVKPQAIKHSLFTSKEMRVLNSLGIKGSFDEENIALSFIDYNPSKFKPDDVAGAVCRFLKKHVPLVTMKDPNIGIWINDIDAVLDSFLLLSAFDTLARNQPGVTSSDSEDEDQKIFYVEFEVSGYVVRFSISDHIIWASDAFLVIDVDPVNPLHIVERIWLAVFKQVLTEVLKSYSTIPNKDILGQLFREYHITIPIE